MVQATYTVEVAWLGNLTGLWTVGRSQVGGTDKVAGYFGNSAFDDISADLRSIPLIERGRANDLGAMQAGRCEIVLNDATGKYNPENSASSLAAYLSTACMRPIRIRATYSGTTYGLFYGFIEEIRHDPDPSVKRSYIRAVDLFERLSLFKPTISATGATTVGAAIGEILDEHAWTTPTMRSLDAGPSIPDFSAAGDTASTQLITDLLTAGLGTCFVAGDGVIKHYSYGRRYRRQSVVATLTDDMVTGVQPTMTVRRVINKQSVTRTGGVEQTVTDSVSIGRNDTREGAAITSSYINDDAQSLRLAQWIVGERANPIPPARQVELVNGDEARLLQILGLDLGGYVSTVTDTDGNAISGWIEHLRMSIDHGRTHRVSYLVAKKTKTVWTVGRSQVGSADVVAYV